MGKARRAGRKDRGKVVRGRDLIRIKCSDLRRLLEERDQAVKRVTELQIRSNELLEENRKLHLDVEQYVRDIQGYRKAAADTLAALNRRPFTVF